MITAFIRTIILYLVLMAGIRLMGKRQIGELEPSELVLTLIIADLASVPMQDFGIPLVNGLIPIATMLCLSMLISFFSLKSIRFRALLCGRPAIIIREGKLLQAAMARNRFTVDELYEQLRGQGVASIADVRYAILETSGKLSVFLYAGLSPVTPKQAGLTVAAADEVLLPRLLIDDGRGLSDNRRDSGHDRKWLEEELQRRNLSSPRQVVLFTVDEGENTVCVPKEAKG